MITESPIAAEVPEAVDPALLAGVKPGFALLLEAHDFARLSGRDFWDFAVEMNALRKAGLSVNGLRWMMCSGYTEQAREVKSPKAERRRFCKQPDLVFATRSCFVLTEAGERFARKLVGQPGVDRRENSGEYNGEKGGRTNRRSGSPFWDTARRELRLNGSLVKTMRVPAADQETILTAFQLDRWPSQIDDPLPANDHVDSRQRLLDAVAGLNRHQRRTSLCFEVDESGTKVSWGRPASPVSD